MNKIPLSPFMHNVKPEYTVYGILFQFLSHNFMNEYSFLKIWICKLQFTISWFNTFFMSVIADSWFFVFTRADEFLDTGHCILFKFLSQNFMNEYSFLKIWICKLQFTISWFNTFFGSVFADSWVFCVHSCRWNPWIICFVY